MPELMEATKYTPVGEARGDELREEAVRSLKEKKEFRGHLFVYVIVNAALWVIWAVEVARNGYFFPWPVFPTFFWGLFVLGQARDVYGPSPLREDKIRDEMERLRRSGKRVPTDDKDKRPALLGTQEMNNGPNPDGADAHLHERPYRRA